MNIEHDQLPDGRRLFAGNPTPARTTPSNPSIFDLDVAARKGPPRILNVVLSCGP
jgi:hypothetical protein